MTNVVIREHNEDLTDRAQVLIFEESAAGKAQTEVDIDLTRSTLSVTLKAGEVSVAPEQTVTLTWSTNAATSGVLTLPGNNPETITLQPGANLSDGQQSVNPIETTTYSLACQGRGPDVTSQVTVSVKEVQVLHFSSSRPEFAVTETIKLLWQTIDASSCALSAREGSGSVTAPVNNGKNTSCTVAATPDGGTLIFTEDESNQEWGRITLATPTPGAVTFLLWVDGRPNPVQKECVVKLLRPTGEFIRTVHVEGVFDGTSNLYKLEVNWIVRNASSLQVTINGAAYSNASAGKWTSPNFKGDEHADTVSITCQGFGGPINLPAETRYTYIRL